MAYLTTNRCRIAGLAACVPEDTEENVSLPIYASKEEAMTTIRSTGILRRHVCRPGVTASDLSVPAVERMLRDLAWDKDSIDCLFYACNTRDYISPQTACLLQDRLGLPTSCFAMDLPLGCAGWVYGMSVITSMVQTGHFKRGLLINADTNTKNRSMKDRTARPLFGDAAVVTAIEYDGSWNRPMNFVFGTDGSGAEAMMMKFGGMRYPTTQEALQEVETEPGVIHRGVDTVVRGMDVFGFAIKQPPLSLKDLIARFNVDVEAIDYLYLHQANKFIDEKIRKAIKVPPEKVPYCLDEFGNVSGASIPLTMVTRTAEGISGSARHCLGCGFGVGLSWASMEFFVEGVKVSRLIEL